MYSIILRTYRIDIVILTQDVYVNGALASILDRYVAQNGVLVCFWEANGSENFQGSATILMNSLFDRSNITSVALLSFPGAIYGLTDINDPILNGPFGDVRGKQWGEDASWAMAVFGVPTDSIDIYSTSYDLTINGGGNNLGGYTAFKHKTKNIIYFGDGGFNSSGLDGHPFNSTIMCPFWWNDNTYSTTVPYMHPMPKPGYGKGPVGMDAYNSIVFCNIMAWALERAENNGINTPGN